MTSGNESNKSNAAAGVEAPAQILVVDDDKDIAGYLSAVLTLAGHKTSEVYSAEEAIESIKISIPDLVLTDLMMPGLGGLGLLGFLKNESSLPFIPVIMVTALHDTVDKAAALEAGADDFLNKPVNKAELQARVQSLLRLKRMHDLLQRRLAENDAALQGVGEQYLQVKQERDKLAERNTAQQQRDMAARIAGAIWRELDPSLTKAINLAQTGLREGNISMENLQHLAAALREALRVTTKLEQLATESKKPGPPSPKIN
jgi:DNA-binding response OmpR family regulator